jgi:hypothetical protein
MQVELDQGVPILYYVLWAGLSGRQYSENNFQSVLDAIASACFERRFLIFAAPPQPISGDAGRIAECRAVTCGTGTCADLWYASSAHVPPACRSQCPAVCLQQHAAPPPPPSPPPPMPRTPAPAPLACAQPCAGGTCGNFYPSSCIDLLSGPGCDCTGCCVSTTDLTCATSKWPTIDLPHLYPFTDGITGTGIRDGGSDMFDGANYLAVILQQKYQYYLPYTQVRPPPY